LCNRGASGIDGILHTALGVALAHAPANCTLLIGDLAALHDLSGLALLSQQVAPLTVVILNNAGGGIFRSLPIAQYPDIFSPYFDTPHPHRFGLACQGFGLQYNQASTRDSFADAYKEAQKRSCPTIIEVVTGPDEHAPLAARMTAVAREVAGTFVL
jgi:2-succinyl-5-enolpyruvyl-6-hydroxy-3-cyclohexene-1-carboxylate synthase